MSDTTQYPDGLYLVTWPDGTQDTGSVQAYRNGSIIKCLDSGRWRIDYLERDGCTLTPLVPAYDYLAARQRIAALAAEVKRLRQEQWTPVADGEYRCQCDPECPSLLQIASDADSDAMAVWMRDEEQIGLVHLHGLRLCKRGAA